MITGTVKWFNNAKGVGFIEPEGGGDDVFAHFSAIAMAGFRTLSQGARVDFELVDGPNGKLAHNIATVPVHPGVIVAARTENAISVAGEAPAEKRAASELGTKTRQLAGFFHAPTGPRGTSLTCARSSPARSPSN